MRRPGGDLLLALLASSAIVALATGLALAGESFTNFESGPVRPLALSADGTHLFAANTPDAKLTVFEVGADGLTLRAEVPVGLEPVAVATRRNGAGHDEVWVANHLSDSVSVVDVDPVDPARSRVVATLAVGDEPRDVVLGGSAGNRAFVTTARRGQNLPASVPAEPETPGIGRALVWAFDADAPGAPLAVVELFGDTPRALATSPDGSTVYAAIFHSGNRTTTLHGAGVSLAGGLPVPPPDSPYYVPSYSIFDTPPFPRTSLIVQYDAVSGKWIDELGRNWSANVRLDLPDDDVFTIDADASPPALVPAGTVTGVGTVLFNMAVRPDDGALFVTNLEARNQIRFEPLIDATHGLAGHFAENRITVVTGTTARPVHVNAHVDYSTKTGPPAEVAASLGLVDDLAFTADGHTLFVTGFGSGTVGAFDADALEQGVVSREMVSVGRGPAGVVVDEARDRLYVLNRLEQSISIVAPAHGSGRVETAVVPLGYDATPAATEIGRRFLYDTTLSGHGDTACASCHVFGDVDDLAWDLGSTYGAIVPDPNPSFGNVALPPFHPMKGPKTTQSFRGLANTGPLHWRGDRSGAYDAGGDAFDSAQGFRKFNPAFRSLLGGSRSLDARELDEFTAFAMNIHYPPNPFHALDDVPTAAETHGELLFDTATACLTCHQGPVGTIGFSVLLVGLGDKVPHLRNLYTKIGMFGQSPTGFEAFGAGIPATPPLGPQIRGFGYASDGNNGSLHSFLSNTSVQNLDEPGRSDLTAFLLAFDTGLGPIVGQQLTVGPATVADPATVARRDLLVARAEAGDCDVVVKMVDGGEARGGVYTPGGAVVLDRAGDASVPFATLWSRAGNAGAEQTWTCVPPGWGIRAGIDRDEDGHLDRDELDAGRDPGDPLSFPGGPALVPVPTTQLRMRDGSASGQPAKRRFAFTSTTTLVPPTGGSGGDPTVAGATLRVYSPLGGERGTGGAVTIVLPPWHWRALGGGLYRYHGEPLEPVTSVRAGPKRITIRGGHAGWKYALDRSAQHRVVVRLTLGAGVDWCAEASGAVDTVDRFEARKVPAPARCPLAPR